jgi:Domain of Unknown Function with PDB structure (DUF3857)/Transglutaminase-like superfamily
MRYRNKLAFAIALTAASAISCYASVPDWVREAAKKQVDVAQYDDETNAVVVFKEEVATVQPNGDIVTTQRRAVRILRPQGREEGTFPVRFDRNIKIDFLRAYTISATGREFEAKEREATERLVSDGFSLYNDIRVKTITAPEAEAQALVAFEVQQRRNPYLEEDDWDFQEDVPTLMARYTLILPQGWESVEHFLNYSKVQPTQSGASTIWELRDIPGIRHEHRMPHWNAVAGRMTVHLLGPGMEGRSNRTWEQYGAWYSGLAEGRRTANAQISQQAKEITASAPDFESKLRAVAGWMQREIRYVSIQIGIGGYQPHPASAIYANRYGDCKDKATLMSSLLREAGIDSEYVIANLIDRNAVNPDVSSHGYFNHMILAIRLPHDEFMDAPAVFKDKSGNRWLLFDPTDDYLPVGSIEGSMQGSYGLLVNENRGELIRFPLVSPDRNYFNRTAKLKLEDDGSIAGEITEASAGDFADDFRRHASARSDEKLERTLERFLNESFAGATLSEIKVENLTDYNQELRVHYKFTASHYAKNAGPLLLVRPRVLGSYGYALDAKDRKYPYEFDYVEHRKDDIEIALPQGLAPDELPGAMKADVGFANYASNIEVKDNVLRYTRTLDIKNPEVAVEQIADLRKLLGTIAMDEKSSAIFKKSN